jgi:hypothetical protein
MIQKLRELLMAAIAWKNQGRKGRSSWTSPTSLALWDKVDELEKQLKSGARGMMPLWTADDTAMTIEGVHEVTLVDDDGFGSGFGHVIVNSEHLELFRSLCDEHNIQPHASESVLLLHNEKAVRAFWEKYDKVYRR